MPTESGSSAPNHKNKRGICETTADEIARLPAIATEGRPAQTRNSGFTCEIAGSRASDARGQASLCSQRHRPPRPHPHCQRFSPRGSAMQAPHRPRTATSPPPNGGNCTIRGATRRRHAVARLLMLQNPHHYPNRVSCGTHERKGQAVHRWLRLVLDGRHP